MEVRLGSGRFDQVKPIQVGETAAMGQKLAGREKWVRVDQTGKATLVQVQFRDTSIYWSTVVSGGIRSGNLPARWNLLENGCLWRKF
jgi:hypothetical protein